MAVVEQKNKTYYPMGPPDVIVMLFCRKQEYVAIYAKLVLIFWANFVSVPFTLLFAEWLKPSVCVQCTMYMRVTV